MSKVKKLMTVILCFMMIFTAFNFNIQADDNTYITDGNNEVVDSISLPKQEKITLQVSSGSSHQWQLAIDGSQWINIYGQNKSSLVLSYAMVSSLLDSNGVTYLRCITDYSVSNIVKVTISYQEQSSGYLIAETSNKLMKSYSAKSIASEISEVQELSDSVHNSYTITVNYQYEDGTIAFDPYVATIEEGGDFATSVNFPTIVGYLPYVGEETESKTSLDINLTNITEDVTYLVTYKPTNVNYTVVHYIQNTLDDFYTEYTRETKQGLTGSYVSDCAIEITGFSSLNYDKPKIAADGSTEVEVYYDRKYYLVSFDLDGGYGVEPIYARYQTSINDVGTPKKAGYKFKGWTIDGTSIVDVVSSVPANNLKYKALWTADDKVSYTVVFWYENADDTNYSYAGTSQQSATIGSSISSATHQNTTFVGRDSTHFTYNSEKAETISVNADGSSVLNVYFKRNTYTLTFRTRSGQDYTTVATITAKWNAEISGEFSKAPFNTTYNGRAWKCTDTNKYSYALQTLDRMPGFDATFNLYDNSSDTKKTIYYYVQKVGTTVRSDTWPTSKNNFELLKQVDTYFNFATYDEEYHEIQGFTRYSASVADFRRNRKDFSNNRLDLYYMRNSYNLKFYNYDTELTGKQASVQYEAPLSSYNFVPDYPSSLEPNAYEFAGWYTSPGFYDGSEVDWDNMKMPASDVMLYAKWVPVVHTVEFYLDQNKYESGVKLDTHPDVTVAHGHLIPETVDIPENGEYLFIGWFYLDNGIKKAFDFVNMPINKDLKVFAEWSSNVLVDYTVYYKLEGTDTLIASTLSSSALAGTSKTFDAKTGNDLYADYVEGYYPVTNSHTITMNIEGGNEYTFYYIQKENVPYTVRYLEKGTNVVLHEEKYVEQNKKSVVTEKFEYIQGYVPDAYQKRLVISANEQENVITFYYEKDDIHAYYVITHWIQNVEGDGYTEYRTIQNFGDIGATISEEPLTTLKGFTYNASKSNASGQLTAEGLQLNLYYDRLEYKLNVKYLEYGTNVQLAEPTEMGPYRYGKSVSASAIDIKGYSLVGDVTRNKVISTENNEIVFYYIEKEVTIKYVAIEEGFGTVSIGSETIKAKTAEASGSTAKANSRYRFVGWFKDEQCTIAVDASWVDENNKLVPGKVEGLNVAATYYAKFEINLADLTIKKNGHKDIDENQSFLFRVQGIDETNSDVDITVVVHGNGFVAISDLVCGNYKVTELNDWSFRYQPTIKEQSVNLTGSGATVSFNNSRSKQYWLDGNNHQNNLFESND